MVKDCNVGIKGLVKVDDACLVLLSTQMFWDIPGGRIDNNETIEQTLARELQEELPTIGAYKMGRLLHAYRLSRNISDDKGLVLLFYQVDATPFVITLSDEHLDYRWVTKDTLPELLDLEYPIDGGYYEALKRALEM